MSDGEYGFNGTSAAAPHVGGAIAALFEDDGVTSQEIRNALFSTGTPIPDPNVSDPTNRKIGTGYMDALAALQEFGPPDVEGTVTDAGGSPLSDVTVSTDGGESVTTDQNGEYSLYLADGSYTLTADDFGYAASSETVTVSDGSPATVDFSLQSTLDARLVDDVPSTIESGSSLSATVEAANAATATVSLTGTYDEANATLTVDGSSASFDDPVSVPGGETELAVSVDTTAGTSGEIALDISLSDGQETASVSTGSTDVLETLRAVGVVQGSGSYGSEVVSLLQSELGTAYQVSMTDRSTVTSDPGQFDVVVAQGISTTDSEVEAFVDAIESAGVGAVYLDQWGGSSNGIPEYADVTAAIESTAEDTLGNVGDPISYAVTADHEILGDRSAGDEVVVHQADWSDFTTFTLASGQDRFEAIADLTHPDGTPGTAMAVDEGTGTVLASSLGVTQYVTSDGLTAEGIEILGNAVQFASGSGSVGGSFDLGWTVTTGEPPQFASPTVDGGRVLLGSMDRTVSAVSTSNRTVEWEFDRAGALSDSAPAINNGIVYVGSGGGAFYALSATDGSVQWTFPSSQSQRTSAFSSTPAFDTSSGTIATVCVGANDGTVYGLNASTGQEEWSVDVGDPVYARPATAGGSVYVTTTEGDVVATDQGSIQWNKSVPGEFAASGPTVHDGTVYVAADQVHAYDAATGTKQWASTTYGGNEASTPLVREPTASGDTTTRVVVGSVDGTVTAYDAADGTESWSVALDGAVRSSPVEKGEKVCVATAAGTVHLLDGQTGAADESAAHPTAASVPAAPTVAGGTVYCHDGSGRLLTFE